MLLTKKFITKTKRLKIQPEEHDDRWSKLNAESPEMEVCEFLYSLVRLIKPYGVLETGGGTGNSSAYIAQGLKDNEKGLVEVLEPYPTSFKIAIELWDKLDLSDYIRHHPLTSFDYTPANLRFQLMFLDSEPSCRFTEVKKFYPNLDSGGIILIHDLKHNPGNDWEDFKPLIGDLIKSFNLQVITLETPRGLTLLQKPTPGSLFYKFLRKIYGV